MTFALFFISFLIQPDTDENSILPSLVVGNDNY